MKDIELYKFIIKNEITVGWRGDELVAWIYFPDVRDFTKLIGSGHFEEGGISVELQERCIALDLVPICKYHGIDPQVILGTTQKP